MELIKPELGPLIWMLLSFGITFFILVKFAWKPILRALKYREDTIERRLNSAKKAKEELAKIEFGNEKITALAKMERETMLKEAKEIKDKIIEEAKQVAKEEAKKIVEQANIDAQNEKEYIMDDLKKQIAGLSIDIAKKILQQELSGEKNQKQLINKLVEDIKVN